MRIVILLISHSYLISSKKTFGEHIMAEHFRDKQAAQYLGVSTSTIWLYAKQGKLHPVRLSPRVTIFSRGDLDAFIASQMEAQAVAS